MLRDFGIKAYLVPTSPPLNTAQSLTCRLDSTACQGKAPSQILLLGAKRMQLLSGLCLFENVIVIIEF